jgi:hypothetical protein
VARDITAGIESVRNFRRANSDAYYFNWILEVDQDFQTPFHPTHENVARLNLDSSLPKHQLAASLRQAFSAIVSGNIKENGIRAIEQYGPFEIRGEQKIMRSLDDLLKSFIQQERMKVPSSRYSPCYQIIDQ